MPYKPNKEADLVFLEAVLDDVDRTFGWNDHFTKFPLEKFPPLTRWEKFKLKVLEFRIRLGEWIAGRKFEDME